MDGNAEIIEIRNETLRKIGRNVVLFQELERVLKFLTIAQSSTVPIARPQERFDAQVVRLRKRTLGYAAKSVLNRMFGDRAAESLCTGEVTEPWLTCTFRIEESAIKENHDALSAVINERNELIHHLLERWNLGDAESCRALSEELDDQRQRIVLEIDKYRAYASALTEMFNELQAFLASEEGKRELDLVVLQQSRLVAELIDVATENSRDDGWTLVSIAGNRLRQLLPDQFTRMKDVHGSLQKLLIAAEVFDVRTEKIENGSRAIYRVRAARESDLP
jgi:hypothetical protein